MGDTVFHYLIDEFQDTAPVQWEALKPLLAEALSKQGSVFLVGDTKQSIYAFRSADWRIMKNLMETVVFPSAPPDVRALGINYRSFEQILEFDKTVFQSIVPKAVRVMHRMPAAWQHSGRRWTRKIGRRGQLPIILGTDSPDYITPATSVVLQHKLGAKNAGTFDIGCACASFPTGLSAAAGIIAANPGIKTVLVVGVYLMHKLTSPADPMVFLLW